MTCPRCGKRKGVRACGGYCQPCVVALVKQGYAWDGTDWRPTARLFGEEQPAAKQVGPQQSLGIVFDPDAVSPLIDGTQVRGVRVVTVGRGWRKGRGRSRTCRR